MYDFDRIFEVSNYDDSQIYNVERRTPVTNGTAFFVTSTVSTEPLYAKPFSLNYYFLCSIHPLSLFSFQLPTFCPRNNLQSIWRTIYPPLFDFDRCKNLESSCV